METQESGTGRVRFITRAFPRAFPPQWKAGLRHTDKTFYFNIITIQLIIIRPTYNSTCMYIYISMQVHVYMIHLYYNI